MINNNESQLITTDKETTEPAPAAMPSIPRQKKGVLPSADIVEQARKQGRTQGRAGCKAQRINMAFLPEVHDFIRTMAKVRGESVTAFVNAILLKAMEENKEVYEQALKFKNSL